MMMSLQMQVQVRVDRLHGSVPRKATGIGDVGRTFSAWLIFRFCSFQIFLGHGSLLKRKTLIVEMSKQSVSPM